MAAFSFGVEFSGQVKAETTLLGYGSDFYMFGTKDVSNSGDTKFEASVSGEKAGASVKIASKGSFDEATLWFAPVDGLKFSVGKVATGSIAQDNFAWWAQNGKTETSDNKGIKVEFAKGAFGTSLAMNAGSNWIDASRKGIDVIGGFTFDINYAIENIGKFQLVVAKDTQVAYGMDGWGSAKLAFGLAYNNMPWESTGYYADVFFGLSGDSDGNITDPYAVYSTIGGQFALNGLMIRLNNMICYKFAGTGDFNYGFMFKTSYSMGAVTPFVKIDGNEIMDSKLGVNLGADCNVGGASISAYVSMPLNFTSGSKFTFSVPVEISVAL